MMTAEELANDIPTLERVLKIVQAFTTGKAKLINNPNDNYVVCSIGGYWFYFLEDEDNSTSVEEIMTKYDLVELAQMVLEAICNLEDEDEYNYYCDILEFA